MPTPTLKDVIHHLKDNGPTTKRDMARHFKIKGYVARTAFKELLAQAVLAGKLAPQPGKKIGLTPLENHSQRSAATDRLVLKVTDKLDDGELRCTPVDENLIDDFPEIILERKSKARLGETISAVIKPIGADRYLATFTRPQGSDVPSNLIGILSIKPNKDMTLKPLVKALSHMVFTVTGSDTDKTLADGAVILAEVHHPPGGIAQAKVLDVLHQNIAGNEVSLGIAAHGLPDGFPEQVSIAAAQLIALKDMAEREDLRDIPLVTIDGADAKDFDDAVWAEPWQTSKVKNGFHLIVAIADVAHYVSEGSPLDKEAYNRGNSVYFPGYVIPMLPEVLSNNLCSLVPHQDRPTLACHMYIDDHGKLHKYQFTRAVIHSHARLTYEQVQRALDGTPDDTTTPLMATTLVPLYNAFKALLKNRAQRGALDLDLPETVIHMADDGKITALDKRDRLDAHRLIEEMMVLANVAAASQLQTRGAPALYRIHPEPSDAKKQALILAFKDLGVKLSKAAAASPAGIGKHIELVKELERPALTQSVLRAQEQARYDAENIGHFGLALQRYAHFTSPIRRYSDLIVHRSLIQTLKLPGHETISLHGDLSSTADHLCITERRAQKAEWDVRDRLIARYYSDFTGKQFTGKVTGVNEFGIFLAIDDGLAEGLLHVRDMHDDHYGYDPKRGELKGRRSGTVLKMGSKVEVVLSAASAENGKLTFTSTAIAQKPRRSSKRPGGSRPDRPKTLPL